MISTSELLNAQLLADIYGQSRMNPYLACTTPYASSGYPLHAGLGCASYGNPAVFGFNQSATSILNNPSRIFGDMSQSRVNPIDAAFAGLSNPVFDTMTSSVFQPQPISMFCRKSGLDVPARIVQQGEQAHIAHDLLMDRRRDTRNLGIINDLLDARKLQQLATGGQSWYDQQVEETVKAIVRDAKYNRKADEIIGNIALGRTHVPHAFEKVEDFENVRFDMAAREMARQLVRQGLPTYPRTWSPAGHQQGQRNVWGLVC